ncbi:MAG: methyl-accepting chemotaxis protein [Pseudomonadota bacterium]
MDENRDIRAKLADDISVGLSLSETQLIRAEYPANVMQENKAAVAISATTFIVPVMRLNILRFFACIFGAFNLEDPEARANMIEHGSVAKSAFAIGGRILGGTGPVGDVHRDALTWVRRIVTEAGLDLSPIGLCARNMEAAVERCKLQETLTPQQTIELLSIYEGAVRPLVMGLETLLQEHFTLYQAEQLEESETARKSALSAVKNIEKLTRTVRLISVNAGVEAARAGEYGQGFSVIAQEVRALSEKVAEAGGEVKSGIDRILLTDNVHL